jgi:glycerol-3-phosphate dehydrogenase (NAD(P)+)
VLTGAVIKGVVYCGAVARVTVFGAGAMGTALAMHAARAGNDTALWASEYDARALEGMRAAQQHPLLPEHIPGSLAVHGPDDLAGAARDVEIAVMGANSRGARSLARMVGSHLEEAGSVVSIAKGLEPETLRRISEVYAEEIPGPSIVAVGGPCLAAELAEGLPTAAVWASSDEEIATAAGASFQDDRYQLTYTDDLVGVELCSMMKNVAAIGLGILDGIGKPTGRDFKNAKAALFTRAAHELEELVTALGGRSETVFGLAGVGDQLVTSLGGRNRLYGEMVGLGDPPADALVELEARGLTVEGVDSTRDVHHLARERGLDLPYHAAVHRVLFEGGEPDEIWEVLR